MGHLAADLAGSDPVAPGNKSTSFALGETSHQRSEYHLPILLYIVLSGNHEVSILLPNEVCKVHLACIPLQNWMLHGMHSQAVGQKLLLDPCRARCFMTSNMFDVLLGVGGKGSSGQVKVLLNTAFVQSRKNLRWPLMCLTWISLVTVMV